MARGPGPPLGVLPVCLGTRMLPLLMSLLLIAASPVVSEKNSFHYMESLCRNSYLQQVYRKADGAVLRSQDERNLSCVVTFQTHTVLQSFMLRFDALHLDCNDHLFIYDSAHAGGNLRADLSCRDTKESVGIISTITNYVTLKYVTDNWGTQDNGFTFVITAVKKRPTAAGLGDACTDFRCKSREYCISSDLVCDGVNHCADGSDESAVQCSRGDSASLLGLPMNTVVVASVCLLLLLAAAVVAVAVCMCRQSNATGATGSSATNTMRNANTSIVGADVDIITKSPGYPLYGLNGVGTMSTTTTTTMLGRPPSTMDATFGLLPGNAHRPAGCLLGYSGVRARLYCQAK